MSKNRFVRETGTGRSRVRRMLGTSGRPEAMVEQLENRKLLSIEWTGGTDIGPLEHEQSGVSSVAWWGGSVPVKDEGWILTFESLTESAEAEQAVHELATDLGREVDNWSLIGRGYYATVRFDQMPSEFSLRDAVEQNDTIMAVDPDRIYEPTAIPDDPLFTDQQWLDNTGQFVNDDLGWFTGNGVAGADISAVEAWDVTTGSRDTIVAVIDTGVDLDHPDLIDNIWVNPGEIPGNGIDDDGNGFVDDVNGWDFGENDSNPDDNQNHGTGAAGMIGAVGNNGVGVSGTAWNVSIISMKISDEFTNLVGSAIIAAHDYLTMMIEDFGHNIVASNNSYGAFAPNFYEDIPEGLQSEQQAIERFIATGATFVASAGNDFNDNDSFFTAYPASYDIPGLISVAATSPDDTLAPYSNFGAESVDLGAPGVGVLTTARGGGYGDFGGTSAAGPVVVGAVALLKTFRPDASATEVRQALIDGVDIIPALQGRVVSGGRINIARSLEIIGTDGPVPVRFDPGPVTSRIDSDTGEPIDSIEVTFNKDVDGSTLDASAATFLYAGSDDEFGTADDSLTLVPVSDVTLRSGETRVVDVELDLTGVSQQRLPQGFYRVTLLSGTSDDPKFQDLDGNLLRGDSENGRDAEYDFEVIGAGGALEPNDTIATATPVAFGASGEATYTDLTLGDGVLAGLDVDLYRIDLPLGGQITATVSAANRDLPSDLDSYLRLFDPSGQEIANNDQFFGLDSYLDFFVTTGGTYYLGVSGFPNTDYDPTLAGSGVTQSTGVYDLAISYEQVVDDRLEVEGVLAEPAPVPAEGTLGVQSLTLDVADTREIKDLNLRLDLDHTYVGDLEITLISPEGTETIVFDRHGNDGDDFDNVLFDDEAASPVADATPPYSGSFRPTNGLNVFDGETANGTWTLVIRDRLALNSGQLNSWSLEFTLVNDIFGPFESNDTLVTATDLGIVGIGASTVEADIGDGGFGTLDRDIFRFTVDEGATLTAAVTSDGALDTSVRLFDADGEELKSSSPAGTFDSTISSFVFPAGGTYFIAVSEATNLGYDPFNVSSGAAAQTTGGYAIDVLVTAGISDPSATYTGDLLTVGLDDDGTFGTAGVGIEYAGLDYAGGFGATSAYGLTASGYNFMNNGTQAATALPVSVTDESNTDNVRVTADGVFRDLSVNRSVTFGKEDQFLVVDIVLTNSTGADLTDVSWLEILNPNQGVDINGSSDTSNDLDTDGKFATASVTTNESPGGLTVGVGVAASETTGAVTFFDEDALVVRDPSQVLAFGQNDPDGASDDLAIGVTFDVGTLVDGASESYRYFIFLGSTAETQAMYDQVNDQTGEGHLAADSGEPATEIMSNGESAATYAYRYYYPAGFSSDNIFSFVPMINPHDQDTNVVVIARYETGEREDVIDSFTIPAQSRGGITTNTPDTFAIGYGNPGGSLVRPLEPYALEIRAERPIAASFSYFDTFLLGGEEAGIGESFTSETSDTWTFASVGKDAGRSDFPVFLNTSDETIKVTTTLLPTGGGDEVVLTLDLEAGRRGGWNLSAIDSLPDGEYGMVIEATGEIVASLSSFDDGTVSGRISAAGAVGLPGLGSLTGATPEGQLGLNSPEEVIGITNANTSSTTVTVTFLLESGSAYRSAVEIDARSRAEIDVAELPNFPTGTPYSIVYESALPVTVSLPTLIFEDGAATTFSDQAYTLWAFGAGFRPQTGFDQNVTEYLRVYNPSDEDTLIEITIRFDGNFAGTDVPLGQETFRATIPARSMTEFDVHEFVTGERRDQDTFYGLTVKGANPVVTYLGRYDAFFPGAFGSLGVPMGRISTI